jgi:hypothetical protein
MPIIKQPKILGIFIPSKGRIKYAQVTFPSVKFMYEANKFSKQLKELHQSINILTYIAKIVCQIGEWILHRLNVFLVG